MNTLIKKIENVKSFIKAGQTVQKSNDQQFYLKDLFTVATREALNFSLEVLMFNSMKLI